MPDETESTGSTITPQAWEAAHWADLQALYHLASEAEPGERTRILRAATQDTALVERVLDLLSSDTEVEDPTTAPRTSDQHATGHIGPFTLLHLIGTGGLGAVYLAQRMLGGAIQQCAVKVLSLHAAGPSMQARFLREQQIIAGLNHPNITRMLDAGFSADGQAYLAMEYVDGDTLTAVCDEQRMSVRDRVELFLQVCDAVSYAHRMLVVHLDLKPSNILVSREGEAKLLDFGTSKLVDPDSSLTTTILATPAYASPEQLRGQPVSTACDVYGLGAVLYELLSGSRPWGDASAVLVMEHAWREQEPPAVTAVSDEAAATARAEGSSTSLRERLRGDLAGIMARCLRSRPADRYATVDALREDLQRYLDGRPVLARPQTLRYRATKFLRRNQLRVAVALAAALLVIASLSYAAVRQHQALVAAHRAVQMQRFMTKLFRLAHTGATGKPAATVGDLLQVGETVLPSFISDPADLRAAQMSIAESMYDDEDTQRALPLLLQLRNDARRSGDVATQARADILASDLLEIQSDHLDQAATLSNEAVALSHDRRISPELRTMILAIFVQNKDSRGDRNPASMDLLRSAIEESDRAHAPEDQTASAMNILGLGLQARGHYAEAVPYFNRALGIYQRTPYSTCDVAATVRYLGSVQEKLGDDGAALQSYQRSYQLQQQCAGPDDLGTLSAHAWYATELTIAGQPQAAIDAIEPDLPRWRAAVGPESMHMRTPLQALASAYLAVGRYHDAETMSREELKVLHAARIAQKSLNMAAPERTLAAALAAQHEYSEALPWAESAIRDFPVTTDMAPGIVRRYSATQRVLAEVRSHLTADQQGDNAAQ